MNSIHVCLLLPLFTRLPLSYCIENCFKTVMPLPASSLEKTSLQFFVVEKLKVTEHDISTLMNVKDIDSVYFISTV